MNELDGSLDFFDSRSTRDIADFSCHTSDDEDPMLGNESQSMPDLEVLQPEVCLYLKPHYLANILSRGYCTNLSTYI